MNLLIFEFATAIGLQNPIITVEGKAILEGLLEDLNYRSVDYLISENPPINISKKNIESDRKCNPINLKEDLLSWLDKNIRNYDACLPVAPEEEFILYHLTKKIENKGIKIIGSSSNAVLTCSDKFETYNSLKDSFPFIKTHKIFFSDLKNYKSIFNGETMVVKPADGVSCSGVHIIRSYAEFIKASVKLKRVTKLPYFLLQNFIDGQSASVSLLSNGKSAIPLSLNLQNIQLNDGEVCYTGGKVPFKHKLSSNAKKISKDAVETIDGLKGYVGVDLIFDDNAKEVYILEVNPRLTTSFVALRNILNFNLGEAIIDAVEGKLPSEVMLDGSLTFSKEEDHLKIDYPTQLKKIYR